MTKRCVQGSSTVADYCGCGGLLWRIEDSRSISGDGMNGHA